MLGVGNDGAEWVGEDGDRFVEADVVLFEVGGGFARVVFEFHGEEILDAPELCQTLS